MNPNRINIKNKKAWYNYELVERFTAGLQLTGTEIKSLREGRASLVDSFCRFRDSELWITGLRISEYSHGTFNNHEPYRDRKLLLTRRELKRLQTQVTAKGLTIVPLRLFINERGWAKMEIALAQGKKTFDKRESIKQKDAKREMERMMKRF